MIDFSRVLIAFEIGPTIASLEDALALAAAAEVAGADALKVQVLDAKRLVGADQVVTYRDHAGQEHHRSMIEILSRRVLPPEQWAALGAACRGMRLPVIATVDFPETLDVAVKYLDPIALKVCSGDVNHLDWIREVAAAKRPIMLDTGNANLGEIEAAVEAACQGGAPQVIVHQCPSGYPARLESVNLNIIPTLIRLFPECVIGYSDHNVGYEMDAAAVALGARMIEKTFCLSREEPWPEYGFSATPQEASRFVEAIRAVETGLGRTRRVLTDQERRSKVSARRSAYTRVAIAEGDVLTPELIEWRRPGGGIEPPDGARLIGWRLLRSLPAGHRLGWDYLV